MKNNSCYGVYVFSNYFLQLYNKYPNKNLTLGVRAVDKQPSVGITPEGANFSLPGAVDFIVIDGDYTPVAFTLGVVCIMY